MDASRKRKGAMRSVFLLFALPLQDIKRAGNENYEK